MVLGGSGGDGGGSSRGGGRGREFCVKAERGGGGRRGGRRMARVYRVREGGRGREFCVGAERGGGGRRGGRRMARVYQYWYRVRVMGVGGDARTKEKVKAVEEVGETLCGGGLLFTEELHMHSCAWLGFYARSSKKGHGRNCRQRCVSRGRG